MSVVINYTSSNAEQLFLPIEFILRRGGTLYRKFYLPQTDWFTFRSIGSTSQEATLTHSNAFLFDYISSSAGLGSTRPFLLPSTLLGGINNFYRPSGQRNGKRRWVFNLLGVWRVLHGFPRWKCKAGATHRNAVSTLTFQRRWRKQYDDSVKFWSNVARTKLIN